MKSSNPERRVVIHPAALRLWVSDSWEIAHALLWRKHRLNKREICRARKYIRQFYEEIPAAFFQQAAPARFHYFCLCVIEYSKVKDFNCSPALWFNPSYKAGFYSWIAHDPYFGLFVSVN